MFESLLYKKTQWSDSYVLIYGKPYFMDFYVANVPTSHCPSCTGPIHHTTPFGTAMCIFLFWMIHLGYRTGELWDMLIWSISDRHIVCIFERKLWDVWIWFIPGGHIVCTIRIIDGRVWCHMVWYLQTTCHFLYHSTHGMGWAAMFAQ